MKYIIIIASLLIGVSAQAQINSESASQNEVKPFVQDSVVNADGTVTIKILTSSECEMCKDALEKAMAYEKGVVSSELNVDTKIFTVTYKPEKTNSIKIKRAVNLTGYDADNMPADPKAYQNIPACCKKGAHN